MVLLKLLVGVALTSLSVPIIAGMLGALHPALDALSHFRMHLLMLLLAATVFAILLKQIWISRFGLMVIGLGLLTSLPHLPGLDRLTSAAAEGEELTLMQLNLRFDNNQLETAVASLNSVDADFIALQEVTAKTSVVLATLESAYPFQLSCRFGAVGSVAIASRHPFVETTLKKCIRAYGLASARFVVDGRQITVASYHSYWPWPFRQNSQIDVLAEHFTQMEAPILIAGDFNAAPWSHAVKRIAQLSGTKPAAGLLSTWAPSWGGWVWPPKLGLMLDNALHSAELSLQSRDIGPYAGSDHLPVISRFRWVEKDQTRSANASSNLLFNIFPVDEAGNASAMMMRTGRL